MQPDKMIETAPTNEESMTVSFHESESAAEKKPMLSSTGVDLVKLQAEIEAALLQKYREVTERQKGKDSAAAHSSHLDGIEDRQKPPSETE